MYVLFKSMPFYFMSILLITYLQETEGDATVSGPGQSSCNIFATPSSCTVSTFWNQLPVDCLSFTFCCLTIDANHTITYMFENAHNEYLDKLGKLDKKLYINFGRDEYKSWTKILDFDGRNAIKEAEAINSFTSKHNGIKGLLLRNLEPEVGVKEKLVGYTEKLIKYIEVVKQKTKLEIAITFHSEQFLAYYDGPQMPWLNFTVLNSHVSFYVFGLYAFSEGCSGSSGVITINGNVLYTLENLKGAIDKSLIPTDKIYYNLALSPDADVDPCILSYQTLCKTPETAVRWCSDTQETLFKLGQWFRKNGAGFIGGYTDTDDPDNDCICGKYPTFNAILAGFNGTASIPACPVFDRSG